MRKRSYVRNSLKNHVKYGQGTDTWNIFFHNFDNDRSTIVPTNETSTHVEKQVDPICVDMHRIADEQRHKCTKLVEAFDLKHPKNPTDIIMQDVSTATSLGPDMINHLNELIRSQDEKIHDLSYKMKAMQKQLKDQSLSKSHPTSQKPRKSSATSRTDSDKSGKEKRKGSKTDQGGKGKGQKSRTRLKQVKQK